MLKTLTFIRHNAILTALFVVLGGTSYVVFSLPAGSVGTKQLRNGAVTSGRSRTDQSLQSSSARTRLGARCGIGRS